MSPCPTCPTGEELSAYGDGRFSGERYTAIESHIADCERCNLELARLGALSRLLAALPRPQLSQIARHRLHDRVDAAMERGLIRFGWSLSGIAASVLVVASALLMQVHGGQTPQAAPPWVGVAVTADAETVTQNASTPAAVWYLADASSASSDTQ